MKTITINNQDFNFDTAFAQRISDDPELGYARVLIYTGNNNIDEQKQWHLNFKTIYIDKNINKIVEKMTHKTGNGGKDWILSNNELVVEFTFNVDKSVNPVPNPDFNPEMEISNENFPFKRVPQFDFYNSFLFNEDLPFNPLPVLMKMGIESDDAKGNYNV